MQAQSTYLCDYTVIMFVTLTRHRSFRDAVGDLTALSRRPYSVSIARLSERSATARTTAFLRIPWCFTLSKDAAESP